jgi:hypothetical protein
MALPHTEARLSDLPVMFITKESIWDRPVAYFMIFKALFCHLVAEFVLMGLHTSHNLDSDGQAMAYLNMCNYMAMKLRLVFFQKISINLLE